jgi:1,4-dihydroxy-2-naphthoyl-CoA hydrolase
MSEPLWKKRLDVDELNRMCVPTIHSPLGIRFTEITPNSLSAEMPVDERTKQPFGVLHGGASVVLAESLGSMATYLVLEGEDHAAFGIEINANHVKAARRGVVTGTARNVHLGRSLHVWQIEVRDSVGDLICTSRLTVLVKEPRVRPT